MPPLASTATTPRRVSPAGIPMRSVAPLRHRIQQALIRWWYRQCLQAERKTRFVPRY